MGFVHEHVFLPLSDLLKGEKVHYYMRQLLEVEQWDVARVRDYQEQRIRELVQYVAKEVPFYKEWFESNSLDPSEIKTLEAFRGLPIVNKTLMRQQGIERFAAIHFPAKERRLSRSGGSTGEPFSFYESKQSYSVNMAAKLRTWYQAGYRLGDRYVKITNGVRSSKIKALQDRVNNCVYLPFYSINDNVLVTLLECLEKTRPLYIRSYPAPLYLLAKYCNSHSGFGHCPRHVFTTGSTLPQTYRDEIERAFGCDVIDSYSCEGTPNTFETVAHEGYEVCGYYGVIEVLDEQDRPINDGIGRVVSTDFWNYAYPFLRYDTQDLVEVRSGKIIRIVGRDCETLLEASGQLLTVHNFTHYFADNYPSVDGWQVVKKHDGSVEMRLVVNEWFNKDVGSQIMKHWTKSLGVPVRIVIVDKLPLMDNNKHLSIVNEI